MRKFELLPPAYYLNALPELQEVAPKLCIALEEYIGLLLNNSEASKLGPSKLLDRIERLNYSLNVSYTSTKEIIKEFLFVLKAAFGFYSKLAYADNPNKEFYRDYRAFTGVMLEQKLIETHIAYSESNSNELKLINNLLEAPHTKGNEQIKFFQKLYFLFNEVLPEKLKNLENLELPTQSSREPRKHKIR